MAFQTYAYYNMDGSVKARGWSATPGGGKQTYSIFGWSTDTKDNTPTERSTWRHDSEQVVNSPRISSRAAGVGVLYNGMERPRSPRPGSARRLKDIAGNNVFSDGLPSPTRKVHAMKMHNILGNDVMSDKPEAVSPRGKRVSAKKARNIFESSVFTAAADTSATANCNASDSKRKELIGSHIFTPAPLRPVRTTVAPGPLPGFNASAPPASPLRRGQIPVGGRSLVSLG